MGLTYLSHHGVKGMKWGVRRYQNPDGSLTPEGTKRYARQNLKRAKLRNFDKWGSDRNHNVLYVIGASGSGKSTTALGLADENDSVIHLDTLFENTTQRTSARNREFEGYCMAKGIDVLKLRDANASKNERRAIIKAVGDQIEPYGRRCYNKGRRVVVEGVQLADDTIFLDKGYFKTRPTITLRTSKLISSYRAATRDNTQIKNIFKDMTDKERAEWYDSIEKHIREIERLDSRF